MASNTLTKKQKEFLLALVAEGLKPAEINRRAASFQTPFKTTRQLIAFYAESRDVKAKAKEAIEQGEAVALATGLALMEERVAGLQRLAQKLEADLLDEGGAGLWLKRVKAVGSGDWTTIVDHFELNAGGINAYRATLDDIAKEVGGRTYGASIGGDGCEDDADAQAGSEAAPKLRIEVEYVGAGAPDASDAAHGAATDHP